MPREEVTVVNGRHPFDEDPLLHARITKVMTGVVQRTLKRVPVHPGREVVVLTGGESIEDIVQEAMSKLWAVNPADVNSYEALAYTIAKDTAIDQLRRSKARRWYIDAKGDKSEIAVGSLSEPTATREDGDEPPTIGEVLVIDDPSDDAHHEFVVTSQAIVIGDLAEALSERDREIFYAVFYDGRSYASVADDWGLSPERISQIYRPLLRALNAEARATPEFEAERDNPEGDEES